MKAKDNDANDKGEEMTTTKLRHAIHLTALAALLALAPALRADTAISTDGAIESRQGGFVFPDGTVQMSASTHAFAPIGGGGSCSGIANGHL